MGSQVAIAAKPIKHERFSYQPGELLANKYQSKSVWPWFRKQFGEDCLEIITDPTVDKSMVHKLVFDRQREMFHGRIKALETENADLKKQIAALEKRLKS